MSKSQWVCLLGPVTILKNIFSNALIHTIFFSVGTLCSSFFSLSCLSRQKPLQIITQAAHSGAVYNSMTSDGHHHLVDLFILMVLLCGNVKQQQYDIQS